MASPEVHGVTTIADIPTKILSNILSYLPRDPDLVKVALVSKIFQHLVDPFLYQSITLILSPPIEGRPWRPTPGNLHRFEDVVKRLSRRPGLCQFVVALHLSVERHERQTVFDHHERLLILFGVLDRADA